MARGSDPVKSTGDASDTERGGALVTTTPTGSGGTDRTPPSLPTTMLERYEIKRLIGTGGMGEVYEALDRNLHRIVALKVLKVTDEDPKARAEAANRLVREARAMAVLSHRNVVTVYDVGMYEAQVYVAMQLVDGMTLRRWLTVAPRTISQVLRVMCDAGEGIAAAHAARLIHRDFKPDNVLVSRRGTARVTDFGLARRAAVDAEDTMPERSSHPTVPDLVVNDHVTRSGAVLGTPAYMAPEQTEGRACDARADQFSFCVTTWEALYGVRPFAGQTWSDIYANIVGGRIVAPDPRVRVPRAVERALRRGLSLEPAHRFATMDELLAVLEREIATRKPWRRFAAIALASAALAVAITWLVQDRRSSSPAPQPATAAESAPRAAVGSSALTSSVPSQPLEPPRPPAMKAPLLTIVRVKPHVDHAGGTAMPGKPTSGAASSTAGTAETALQPVTTGTAPSTEASGSDAGQRHIELDAVRADRSAFAVQAQRRGIRVADWTGEITAALAETDRGLASGDADRARAALAAAQRALAAVAIDRAFIDAKLARFNKTARVPAGREEEFRALFAQLKTFVQAGQFTEANAVLNDLNDRLAK